MYKYVEADLPDVATLKDVKLQTPMQVYSADGELIAQFGEKRRIPLTLSQIPPMVRNAFIATEDSRFYDHHGIDPIGIFPCRFCCHDLRSCLTGRQYHHTAACP